MSSRRVWTSRRLLFAAVSFWSVSVLVWFEKIDGGNFSAVAIAIVTGYYANRAVVDGFGRLNEKPKL